LYYKLYQYCIIFFSHRLKQKGYLQNSTDEKEFGAEYDHVPPNERAKSLQRKLEQKCLFYLIA